MMLNLYSTKGMNGCFFKFIAVSTAILLFAKLDLYTYRKTQTTMDIKKKTVKDFDSCYESKKLKNLHLEHRFCKTL